jgi:hypothetical protein
VGIQDILELLQTNYCERAGPGAFDEPLNAVSNLAFVIAAALAVSQIRAFPPVSRGAKLLPWSLVAVSLASTIYHTLRSPVTFILDLLFLILFILGAIFLVLRKVMTKASVTAVVGALFIGIQIILLIFIPNDYLNGSISHLVTFVFVLLLMGLVANRYASLLKESVLISAFYALAIVFRTIDMALCTSLPIGTHFMWHIMGATAGFFVIRFVLMLEVASQRHLSEM